MLKIQLSDRFLNDTNQRALMVVDGTDFKIKKVMRKDNPKCYDVRFYSHKFKSAGLRYEVATCINTGEIVWFNGPFPAGRFPDIKIFRLSLKKRLLNGELVWADLGYRGDDNTFTPNELPVNINHPLRAQFCRARAYIEAINGRFKRFGALKHTFRHSIHKHHLIFIPVAIILQLEIRCGFTIPFQCISTHQPH